MVGYLVHGRQGHGPPQQGPIGRQGHREATEEQARGHHTLPLFEPVTSALEALYTAQLAGKATAGAAYAVDVDNGHVRADELGAPMHSERYSDEFHRIAGALPASACTTPVAQ